MFRLTLIAAVSDDGFVSRGHGVPWSLPDDTAHFRAYTLGKWLLVGRTTYQEMDGWFQHGHTPLVVTREPDFQPRSGHTFPSPTAAIAYAQGHTDELVCIGGAALYASVFPLADRLVITHVHTQLGHGKAFPGIDPAQWRPASSTEHAADARHRHPFTITTYTTSALRGNV